MLDLFWVLTSFLFFCRASKILTEMRNTFGTSDSLLLSINSSLEVPIKHQDNPWASQVSLFRGLLICYCLLSLSLFKWKVNYSLHLKRKKKILVNFWNPCSCNFFVSYSCKSMQFILLSPEICDRYMMPLLIKILVAFLALMISMRYFVNNN